MHNSYFFLKQLAQELSNQLLSFSIVSCFCQDKDELVIELNNRSRSFFIKAHLQSDFCCLSFPTSFARARKNSIDLFPEIILKEIQSVRQFENERSFALILAEGYALLFKMHGNRANVVLLKNESAISIFRNHLKADLEIKLDKLDRPIEWTYEYFQKHQNDLKKGFFTMSQEAWTYLNNQGLQQLQGEPQWLILKSFYEQLTSGEFFITKKDKGISLSLFPNGVVVTEYPNAIKAINEFFHLKMKTAFAQSEQADALKVIQENEKQTIRYIEKNKTLLQSLQNDQQYQRWADLIMANLYGPPTTEGEDGLSAIKLNPAISLQENATEYYRKAKNQKIEITKLRESIAQKEMELAQLLALKEKLMANEGIPIKKIVGNNTIQSANQKEAARLPYKEIEYNSFLIRIGRNAKDNDELTLKYAHKEDLWLHAKDVSGSHVVIKHQSGKPFPKDVIERAAELAALNSKRKGESLCPVAITTKKFVRKRKGDPAGLMVVERERVIMVEPR